MEQLVSFFGPWFWWIAAGLMLMAELAMPGVLFIWLGCAAALVGLADLIWDFSWQIELMLFAGLSLVLTLTGWPLLKRFRNPVSDQPHLNQRMEGLVGSVYTLEKPLENGRGKLQVGDTLWDVEGPEKITGNKVRIVARAGMKLVVEAA